MKDSTRDRLHGQPKRRLKPRERRKPNLDVEAMERALAGESPSKPKAGLNERSRNRNQPLPDILDFALPTREDKASFFEILNGIWPRWSARLAHCSKKIQWDDEPVIWVPACVTRMVGDGNLALVLSQLLYWFSFSNEGEPRTKIIVGGQRYLVTTHGQLGSQTGLGSQQVVRALNTLVKRKLIVKDDFLKSAKTGGGRRTWIYPNFTALDNRYFDTFGKKPQWKSQRIDKDCFQWAQGERGVAVPVTAVRMTQKGNSALLLAQLCYWFLPGKNGKPRARIFREEKRWCAKKHEEWASETGMSPDQVKRAIARLEQQHLVEKRSFSFQGPQKVVHLRPNFERLMQEHARLQDEVDAHDLD